MGVHDFGDDESAFHFGNKIADKDVDVIGAEDNNRDNNKKRKKIKLDEHVLEEDSLKHKRKKKKIKSGAHCLEDDKTSTRRPYSSKDELEEGKRTDENDLEEDKGCEERGYGNKDEKKRKKTKSNKLGLEEENDYERGSYSNKDEEKKTKSGIDSSNKEKELGIYYKEGEKKKRKKGKTTDNSLEGEKDSETGDCSQKDEAKKTRPKTDNSFLEDEKTCEGTTHINEIKKKKVNTKSDRHGLEEEIACEGRVNGNKDEKKKKQNKSKSNGHGSEEEIGYEGESCTNKHKKKKKKTMSVENGSEEKEGKPRMSSNAKASESPKTKRTSKRVSFSDDVEIFPSSNGPSRGKSAQADDLVRGKRFSKEEDEMIKQAVLDYVEAHRLGPGDEGINKVLRCKAYPELKNCWKEIGTALPWRPSVSIYYRAHILFERGENRKWTKEELEFVRNFHESHGSDWKMLAEELGKHRFHVKDTWRRIKPPNMKKGQWSQDEYQNLFDLVNMDLRMRASEERKSKHGMLRDNICWEAISDRLSTRSNANCCLKWYRQLTSPMVAEGIWADTDDYLLLDALSYLDACSMEDVDWDNLLEHRPGNICRKRWGQMIKHIGEHGNKSFSEQVETLSKRYCADLQEAREVYDSKPLVD